MGFFSDLWSGIKNGVSNVWNGIKNTASTVWNAVKKPISYIPFVGEKIVNGVETLGNAIDQGAKGIGHLASGNVSGAIQAGRDAYNGVKEGVNKLSNLKKGGMVQAERKPLVQAQVGGTHPYVMQDGMPKAVSFQR